MSGFGAYLLLVGLPVGFILWLNLRAIARQRRARAERDAWTDAQRHVLHR